MGSVGRCRSLRGVTGAGGQRRDCGCGLEGARGINKRCRRWLWVQESGTVARRAEVAAGCRCPGRCCWRGGQRWRRVAAGTAARQRGRSSSSTFGASGAADRRRQRRSRDVSVRNRRRGASSGASSSRGGGRRRQGRRG
ncbi:hypothetical protein ACJRO7_009888 [Eucalyptus globulus]|uniref:Uncharacterized protein n=1 Tax=Eucalyptus globulus TaxID=34317 RepID=A0ABD3LAA5_EUCGL